MLPHYLIKQNFATSFLNFDSTVQKMIEGSLKSDKLSEKYVIDFGKYKGTSISQVPTDYLQYCLDNFDNFYYKEQFKKALNLRKNSLTITN